VLGPDLDPEARKALVVRLACAVGTALDAATEDEIAAAAGTQRIEAGLVASALRAALESFIRTCVPSHAQRARYWQQIALESVEARDEEGRLAQIEASLGQRRN